MDSLFVLLLSLLFILRSTTHAFVPTPDRPSSIRTISAPEHNRREASFKRTRVITSYSILQTVASGLPAKILIVRDLSEPLSSMKESISYADPDVEAELLSDISHVLLDFTAFFKIDVAFLNYAQLAGRIAFITIDFLPGHAFHAEEMILQLYFLALSVQKIQAMNDCIDGEELPTGQDTEQFDQF